MTSREHRYPRAIATVRKLVLVGALLALLFGPRLAASDAGSVSPSTLTAAVLGPTTSDHDSIASSVDNAKRTIEIAAAVLAAVLLLITATAWRPALRTIDHDQRRRRGQRQRRRGPPLLPA